mmetsp:Transcript_110145/g.329284  ORF Transcript_110145/g.329284 Transcript_110145/m.329284 type:complete len:200 (+) Transcript_110145:378-977(+)
MLFGLVAAPLLGIERFLYGYIYHFPESFKVTSKRYLKPLVDADEECYWLVAKHLGVVIKVFQFGVIGYDLLLRCSLAVPPVARLCVGLPLLGLGQWLNMSVFGAIGAIGVYYGSQLGYKVPWHEGFPYNLGISDPQYWGVVLCVWGMYLTVMADGDIFSGSYLVPWLETFWYVASMKLLEHKDNGRAAMKSLGIVAHDE